LDKEQAHTCTLNRSKYLFDCLGSRIIDLSEWQVEPNNHDISVDNTTHSLEAFYPFNEEEILFGPTMPSEGSRERP
jgi:hypothetical protein